MNSRIFFAQILTGVLLFGSVFVSGSALAAGGGIGGAVDEFGKPLSDSSTVSSSAATCTNETVTNLSAISDESVRKGLEKQIEDNTKINKEREGQTNPATGKPYEKLPVAVMKTTCGRSVSYGIPGSGAGKVEALPQIFTGKEGSPCEVKNGTDAASMRIECSVKKAEGSAQAVTQNQLRLPICELVEQAIVSGGGNKELQNYGCSELIDPLPATFFKGNSDTKCAQRKIENGVTTYTITDSTKLVGGEYCNAILSKTDGGFGAIFAFVRLVYDISLPILVALAVISLVGLGVFVMYAPNGGEETLKKAKDMAFRIASGFLLLLLMRVFLGLISADLFGPPSDVKTTTQNMTPNTVATTLWS